MPIAPVRPDSTHGQALEWQTVQDRVDGAAQHAWRAAAVVLSQQHLAPGGRLLSTPQLELRAQNASRRAPQVHDVELDSLLLGLLGPPRGAGLAPAPRCLKWVAFVESRLVQALAIGMQPSGLSAGPAAEARLLAAVEQRHAARVAWGCLAHLIAQPDALAQHSGSEVCWPVRLLHAQLLPVLKGPLAGGLCLGLYGSLEPCVGIPGLCGGRGWVRF